MSTDADIPLPADLAAEEPDLAAEEKKIVQIRAKVDIFGHRPRYRFANAQCRAVKRVLDGLRWVPNRRKFVHQPQNPVAMENAQRRNAPRKAGG